MKKIFIALSVLAMVAFVAVPCQALIGMPDAMPGSKTVIPFWIVDISASGPWADFTGNNTLVTLTEVEGFPISQDPVLADPGRLHLEVFTQRSKRVFDKPDIFYSKYDVVGIDMGKLINGNVSTNAVDELLVDLDGDGTDDHYMGYATVTDVNYPDIDHWLAHLYQLDLTNGEAAGVVIPVKEVVPNGACADYLDAMGPQAIGARTGGPGAAVFGYEAFNADALWTADNMIKGLFPLCDATATSLRLMPRYYIHDAATGKSYLIVWQSQNLMIPLGAVQPFPAGGELHVYWFDEEENKLSSNIKIPNEVNLIDIEYFLPGGLMVAYPYAGWLDMDLPAVNNAPSPWSPATEMLAYSWQIGQGSVQESWSVLFDVHRDADGTT